MHVYISIYTYIYIYIHIYIYIDTYIHMYTTNNTHNTNHHRNHVNATSWAPAQLCGGSSRDRVVAPLHYVYYTILFINGLLTQLLNVMGYWVLLIFGGRTARRAARARGILHYVTHSITLCICLCYQ